MIVRRLFGNDDAVRVAFLVACRTDAHEAGLAPEVGQTLGADITHPGTKAAQKLENEFVKVALVGHLPFDPFGYGLAAEVW